MANKPPAFQFYAKDWLSSPSVRMMTVEQRGAYIQLLATAWDSDIPGTLPKEEDKLATLSGCNSETWQRVRVSVLAMFEENKYGGSMYNRKMREQGLELKRLRKERSKAGIAGAKAKWENPKFRQSLGAGEDKSVRIARMRGARERGRHTSDEWLALLEFCEYRCARCKASGVKLTKGHVVAVVGGGSDLISNIQPLCGPCNSAKGVKSIDYVDRLQMASAIVLPLANDGSASASAFASASATANLNTKSKDVGQQTTLAMPAQLDRFEEFWKVYPKKVSKVSARKAWMKIAGANGHAAEIIIGVEMWKSTEQWGDPRYIPHPATFLNERRWEDEVPKGGQGGKPRGGNIGSAEERDRRNFEVLGIAYPKGN